MPPLAARARRAALLLGAALLLAACAAGATDAAAVPGTAPAGFWLGLWHGVIIPVTWLVSLFTDRVGVYEVHNNGNWYDTGFVLGIAVVFGGGRSGRRAGRRSGRLAPKP